jgi:superoxide dismutase
VSSAKLPDLPYDFGALEPAISGEIMEVVSLLDDAN